ncbi:response regulator transcription factor [Streptomyces sp. NBC_01476]|uniref:response regulator transcription factor n=1 Tax=Streptomyces sp. NBC_01476 TaxID=2903881 RepID=UPI002E363B06|nr:response regulator transcription factor [Streptomyces sp. NBC_01476]
MTEIAIVEHHSLVRRGLQSLIVANRQVNLATVTQEPTQLDPGGEHFDAILYGPSPQAEDTLAESIGLLAKSGRVLIIADFWDRQTVTEAVRAGAFGCVTRQSDDEEMLRAVDTVTRGGLYLSPGLATRLHVELREPTDAPPALARREIETLRRLAEGLTHGQIARRMGLTEATVNTYVKRIRNKLNVGNKADLTRKAIELGLLREGLRLESARDHSHVPPAT